MSVDYSPPAPIQPPSLLISVITRLGSHLFTLAAGALAVDGVIQQDQQAQFVSLAMSVMVWFAGWGWNEYVAYTHRKTTAALVAQVKAAS